MLSELEQEQPIFYEEAIIPIRNHKTNHAYLLDTGNNDDEYVQNILMTFIKEIFTNNFKGDLSHEKLEHLLEKREFPDLIEIYPENDILRKDQFLDLKKRFQDKSVYNSIQMYIVYHAEKLNSSAANSILKFLEEPQEGIIGIFVTRNRYQVINTILSRCIVLKLLNVNNKFSLLVSEELQEFTNDIIGKKNLLLAFDSYFNNLFQNREKANSSLQSLKNMLEEYLQITIQEHNPQINLTNVQILNLISVIDEAEKKVKYNVNIKLWLDSFLLSIMEVLNESSGNSF